MENSEASDISIKRNFMRFTCELINKFRSACSFRRLWRVIKHFFFSEESLCLLAKENFLEMRKVLHFIEFNKINQHVSRANNLTIQDSARLQKELESSNSEKCGVRVLGEISCKWEKYLGFEAFRENSVNVFHLSWVGSGLGKRKSDFSYNNNSISIESTLTWFCDANLRCR